MFRKTEGNPIQGVPFSLKIGPQIVFFIIHPEICLS
jgi:hypothetical protein